MGVLSADTVVYRGTIRSCCSGFGGIVLCIRPNGKSVPESNHIERWNRGLVHFVDSRLGYAERLSRVDLETWSDSPLPFSHVDDIRFWRWGASGRFYLPVARMYVYFCGLLTLGWFSLFLYAISFPPVWLYVLDGLGVLLAIGIWLRSRRQAFGPASGRSIGSFSGPSQNSGGPGAPSDDPKH